jgi:hypothetical protein
MSGRSSIDSLRRLAPVSDSEAAAIFGTPGCEELLADLTRLPLGRAARPDPASRRRRRRLVLAAAALAVAATATAATWAFVGSPARETTSVQCLIGTSDAVIPSTSGNPAHDCAVDYGREFGTAAPQLAAYDNGLGGVTVIPRSAKPQAGWKRLVSGQDVDLIQLQDSLDDYINGLDSSCLSSAAATSLTESRLTRFGFTGWTVALRSAGSSATNLPTPKAKPGGPQAAPAESTTGTRTCVAGDVVDPSTQSVTLIPTSVATGTPTAFEKLAGKLRPLTKSCLSLSAAVTAVRAAAAGLGLSASAGTYELDAVAENSLRCASIYETVGGTIFLTVYGPHS